MPTPSQIALDRARSLVANGRLPEARAAVYAAAQRAGNDAAALRSVVELLLRLGDFEPASYWCSRLLALTPNDPNAWYWALGAAMGRNRQAEAENAARKYAELSPGSLEAQRMLSFVLQRVSRFREAGRVAKAALARHEADADLWVKAALAAQSLGRTAEASALYRSGLERCPDNLELMQNVAVFDNYDPGISAIETRNDHARFGAALKNAQPARVRKDAASAAPHAPLRVGIVSPDLRRHSVSSFAESIFAHVDRERVELFAYLTFPTEDAVTARLKNLVGSSRWRTIVHPTPDSVEASLLADDLDLVVELSGLTRSHSLGALARRPAPVLSTYLGYPNTTGLPGMDYRIVDSLTDPPGPSDEHCTERLVRIDPCFLCYTPPPAPEVPAVRWSPGPAGRPIVFGSFNNLMKTNDRLLALWARLLDEVPGSRLALKTFGLDHEEVRDDLLARCRAAGLDEARIDLLRPPPGLRDHLDAYNGIDIGLDTFPYHGTTTTCEALLMGLPTVAIAGDRHVSRVSVRLLTNVDLPDLIARDEDDYVRIAAALARDHERLADLRLHLRERFLSSPLCDGPAFGKRFTDALVRMAAGVNRVPAG